MENIDLFFSVGVTLWTILALINLVSCFLLIVLIKHTNIYITSRSLRNTLLRIGIIIFGLCLCSYIIAIAGVVICTYN